MFECLDDMFYVRVCEIPPAVEFPVFTLHQRFVIFSSAINKIFWSFNLLNLADALLLSLVCAHYRCRQCW